MKVDLRQALMNLRDFRADPLALFAAVAAQGDGVSFFDLGVRHAAVLTSPAAITTLLSHPDFAKDPRPFGWAGTFRGFAILKELIGAGLPVLDGDEASGRRRWVLPAFAAGQRGWITQPPTNANARLLELLAAEPADNADLEQVLARLVFEQLCSVLFGEPYPAFSNELTLAMAAANRAGHRLSSRAVPWAQHLPGRDAQAMRQARRTLVSFAGRVLDDLALRVTTPGPTPAACFALKLDSLTREQQVDEVVTMLVAGTESTSLAASWIALLLAQHPAWWATTQTQVDTTPSDELRRLTLSSETPLSRCVREGLRLYPSFWQFLRVAQRDTELAGRPVSSGTIAFMSPYLSQRDPARFEAPDEFRPDRADAQPALVNDFFTFGHGPRSCVGGRLAVSLIIDVIAALLATAEISPLQDHRKAEPLMFGLKRVGGFRFSVQPRRVPASS